MACFYFLTQCPFPSLPGLHWIALLGSSFIDFANLLMDVQMVYIFPVMKTIVIIFANLSCILL